MDKCAVCGTTAGYKLTNTTAEPDTFEYLCLEHAVDTMTTNKTTSYTLEALPHTRKLGVFYNTGGFISAS